MANPNQAQGPEAIMQMMWAASPAAVLSTGVELGVFGALDQGPLDASALAERVRCPARSTRILADALVAIGLLTRSGNAYALAPHTAAHLVPGKPMYLGDFTGITGNPMMWTGLMNLTAAVRAGGSVHEKHAETPAHPFWETFAQSSASMAMPTAMALEATTHDFFASRPNAKLLDIAAGSGLYGYTFAKANPTLDVTLLDWPNVIPHTKSWADKIGVDKSRVHYLEGDLFTTPYGGPYDAILLSHVYHHFEPSKCIELTKKVASALKPGGRILINDFLADDANPMSRLFGITMLTWTKKGEAFTAADYTKWLGECGFREPTIRPSAAMPTSFVIAEKI